MKPIFSPEEMRMVDHTAMSTYNIKGIVLMENAARFSFELLKQLLDRNFIIICGSGNNGGDGYALARQIYTHGGKVEIYRLKAPKRGDAKKNSLIAKKIGIPIFDVRKLLKKKIKDKIIVDAIFGTGLNKEIKGTYKEIIQWINSQKEENTIVSLDIPSGLSAHSGKVLGVVVDAQIIPTFGGYKRGFFQNEGVNFLKNVFVDTISTPPEILQSNINTFDKPIIQSKKHNSNKYSHGKVAIIAGSKDYVGAPIIASMGLLNSGAGMLYLITPKGLEIKGAPKEIIPKVFPSHNGYFSEQLSKKELEFIEQLDGIIIGPGLGKFEQIPAFLETVFKHFHGKMVIDADAIVPAFNILKGKEFDFDYIFTPHLGEFKRIFPNFNNDIFDSLLNFSANYHMNILLKGPLAYYLDQFSNVFVQTHASPYMARGGTGDGLSGLLGGLWANHYSLMEAVNLSTYLIGKTAELLEENGETITMSITKILDNLNLTLQNYE